MLNEHQDNAFLLSLSRPDPFTDGRRQNSTELFHVASSRWLRNGAPTHPIRGWLLLVLSITFLMLPTKQAHALIGNIKASYPENYSVEIGLVLPVDSKASGFGGWYYRGPTLSFEAGTHGHKAHVGYGELMDKLYAWRWSGFYMWADDDHRHIGIEGFVSLAGICGAVGVMRRTDKNSYTVTLGVGVGF